jgi:hypothetical protein
VPIPIDLPPADALPLFQRSIAVELRPDQVEIAA